MIKIIFSSIMLATAGFAQLEGGPSNNKIWWHQESDIAVDKKATFGKLENGFRYIIYPNAEPPGRMSVRLHVNAGSLEEADDQQGMAHFLEHMLFEGSKNYTSAELIPEMQRLGIAFGAHANAYTSFDETVYKLDLPNLEQKTVDLCFTVMRDFCDGALLETKEIEAERGVILSEKNSRDSVSFRLMKQQFDFLMPDFLASKRFPIGIEETIKNTPPERIRDFYKDFYDPSRMTFVVVGDIDPKEIEARIKKDFSSLQRSTRAVKLPEQGSITEPKELTPAVFTDPEVDEDDISLTRVLENVSQPDTMALRKANITLGIAHSILSNRLNKVAKEEGSPINTGAGYKYTWFDEITFGTVTVTPSEGKWQEAVAVLEQEFRRAMEHGFTQAEFQEATSSLLTGAEQAVEAFEKRQSSSIAGKLISSLNDRKVITTAKEELRIVQELLAGLKPEHCHSAFKDFWDVPGMYLILTTKEDSGEAQKNLLSLYQESQKVAVSAPEEKVVGEFAYQSFGDPSTITEEKHIEDLDVHQFTLSNGIKVNLKKTDFESGKVYLTARVGSGLSTIKNHTPGIDTYVSTLLNLGGLKEHSSDDLRQLLSDKVVGLSFSVGEDATTLSGVCNADDLEVQLQLLGAYLTAPGFRPEAHRLYLKALPDQYEQLSQTLEGSFQQMYAYERGGDPRYSIPPEELAQSFKPEQAQSFMVEHITGKPMELTLVGDLEIEDTQEALKKVLGSHLTVKDHSAPPIAALHELPKTGQAKEFHYSSKIDRAAAVVSWRTTGLGENISQSRRLNLVSSILSNRMRDKIREELGSSYSPYAYSEMDSTHQNYGNIKAVSICKPEDMKKISDLVRQIGEELATKGATQDELDRVQKPAISNLDGTLRNNGYWLSTVLAKSQAQPRRLDWARSRSSDYESVTLDEINKLAADYLMPSNANTYHISPKPE